MRVGGAALGAVPARNALLKVPRDPGLGLPWNIASDCEGSALSPALTPTPGVLENIPVQ